MVSSSGLFEDQIGQDIECKRSQTMKRMIGSLIVLESEYYVLTAAITNLRLIQCTFCCVRFSVYLFLFWRVNVIIVLTQTDIDFCAKCTPTTCTFCGALLVDFCRLVPSGCSQKRWKEGALQWTGDVSQIASPPPVT